MGCLKIMGCLKVFAVSGSLLAVSAALARAADLPATQIPFPRAEPRLLPFDVKSGWYLRGDLGYAWGSIDGAQSSLGFPSPTTNSLGNGLTGGIGVGIKSHWLRTDVTVDYLAPLKYRSTFAVPGDATAKVSAWSALFNG